jgi:spermidine synthase
MIIDAAVTTLFAVTLLVSALLLFCVQPMIAKMILPLLGGSPSVWNVCMVFFQAMLLSGYAYAHVTTIWLGVRRQVVLHLGLLSFPLLVLPFAVTQGAVQSLSPDANPTPWLLGVLLATVGLPFFVVATTAPLLQMWFAETGNPSSKDPYFLYGASNFGSLFALLGYPILMEPYLRLAQQSGFWAVGYGVLLLLTAACAVVVLRGPRELPRSIDDSAHQVVPGTPRIGERLYWVGLAFIPSSLLLGVTTYLSSDVAAIPLFWVIPLAIYLVTFILAFSKREFLPISWIARAARLIITGTVLVICLGSTQAIFIPLHLLMFFLASLVCHAELARRRPAVRYLTEFYLAVSLGGVLGGVFNALVAPAVFDRGIEYPLLIVLACLALPGVAAASRSRERRARVLDFVVPLVVGAIICAARVWLGARAAPAWSPADLAMKVVYGLGALACFTFADRPLRFALGIAWLFGTGMLMDQGEVIHRERSFFGSLKIVRSESGPFHQLFHGNTLHGQQSFEPERRGEPLSYYHRTGPVGQIFEVHGQRAGTPDVAVVGLGTGSLASYAQPGERWTFYEIDPSVARIASDAAYFTFLRDCRARAKEIVLGDARLRLREAPEHQYGLIVLDAFSSDAIPVHLLTREALELYLSKLAPEGLIAFHISNRYLDLAAVVGALAREKGLVCRVRHDLQLSPEETSAGKYPSIWSVMARGEAELRSLAKDAAWAEPKVRPSEAAWTDDFSSVFEHFLIQ